MENSARYRKDSSRAGSLADQSHYSTETMPQNQGHVVTSAPVTSVENNPVEGSDRVDHRRQPRRRAPASPAMVQMPKQRLVLDFFPAAPGVLAAEKAYLDISGQGDQELLQGCSHPRKSKPGRFSPGRGSSQAQSRSNTGSVLEIFGCVRATAINQEYTHL